MIELKSLKVGVLLAAFNGEKYIQEQINSIINQVGINVYIYISIDASTDNTLEVCKKIQALHSNIFIISHGDEYFGSAGRNFYHLIRNVDFEQFDFIALSDQDDIWKPQKILRGIQIIQDKKASGYSSDVECFWDDGRRKNKIIKKSYPQKKYDYYFEPAGPGCTYILEKKLAIAFQEKIKNSRNLPFHHDWYIYAFARKENFIWHIDNQPNIYYRQHRNNQVGANIGISGIKKRISMLNKKIYKKHHIEILNAIGDKKTRKNIKCLINKNPFQFRRKKMEAALLYLLNKINYI